MTKRDPKSTEIVGTILEEEVVLSLAELCRASQLSAERVIELANEGIVDPIGRRPESWQFRGRVSLTRGEEGWHAGVNWQEDAGIYDLMLSGPLGQGAVQVSVMAVLV